MKEVYSISVGGNEMIKLIDMKKKHDKRLNCIYHTHPY